MTDDLLTLSKRATDAVLKIGLDIASPPAGAMIARWAPGVLSHGWPLDRTGEDDSFGLLDDVAAGTAVIDLRDDLTRTGGLLEMVTRLYGAEDAHLTVRYDGGSDRWLWRVELFFGSHAEDLHTLHPSRTEALVAALETAP
jgi:hypothetical protein